MKMSDEALLEKWNRRHSEGGGRGTPAQVLMENIHLLTPGAEALDLACGQGANALALASAGLNVSAWDISPVAIEQLDTHGIDAGLKITTEVRNVISSPPAAESFDLILVSHFLERSLCPAIIGALKPGGLLFYQTFGPNRVNERGPANPCFRLAENELLSLFESLIVRFYREEGGQGDTSVGSRDLVMLVAEKRSG